MKRTRRLSKTKTVTELKKICGSVGQKLMDLKELQSEEVGIYSDVCNNNYTCAFQQLLNCAEQFEEWVSIMEENLARGKLTAVAN